MNHQNSVGRTRDKIITSPAQIATQPHMPRRPFRTANRPPHNVFLYIIREGRSVMTINSAYSPMICAVRSVHKAGHKIYTGLEIFPRPQELP